MIGRDDFHKPAQLYVVDSEYRSWRTLWRKKERKRLLFAGYMRGISQSGSMNSPYQLSVDFEDAIERLQRSVVYIRPENESPPADPDLEGAS